MLQKTKEINKGAAALIFSAAALLLCLKNNVFVFFDIIDDNGNILMNYDKLIGSIFK